MRAFKRMLMKLVVAVALAIPAIAVAGQLTYFSGSMGGWSTARTNGWNYYQWNRVYHGLDNLGNPTLFAVYYEGPSQYREGYENPVWNQNPGGYTRSYCANVGSVYVASVTCQTYT